MSADGEIPNKLAGVSRIPIRWGDMDAIGHVNNTVYFRYMEQGRIEMLDRLGIAIDPQGKHPVIVSTACTFLVPLTYPGEAEIRIFTGSIGRSSFQTRMEIRRVGAAELCAEGTAKIVWIDAATGRSTPLPPEIRAWLEAPGEDR